MTTYTPGPWGIEIAADGINKWVGCPRYTVATVSQLPNQVNIGEADANAALIAAAPELLEFLKKAVQFGGLFPDLKEECEAAIAKATGATS